MIIFKPIANKDEYKDFVEKFSFLVDSELKRFENGENLSTGELASQMPKLISLVNCIGYLRGQDGAFSELNLKEHDPLFNKDLYKNEDAFETRLDRLVEKIKNSSELPYYKRRLENYFVESRGGAPKTELIP